MSKRPASIDLAAWLMWFLAAAGFVVTVLVVIFRDDLQDAWSPGRFGDSTVRPLDFVPVVIVLYVVTAILVLALVPLLRHGHNWSRHCLAAIVIGILIATVSTMRTAPPPLFRGLNVAAGVLAAVTLVFLWHVDSRRYCLRVPDGSSHDRDGVPDEVPADEVPADEGVS